MTKQKEVTFYNKDKFDGRFLIGVAMDSKIAASDWTLDTAEESEDLFNTEKIVFKGRSSKYPTDNEYNQKVMRETIIPLMASGGGRIIRQ